MAKIKILLGTVSANRGYWLPYSTACLISYAKKFKEVTNKYYFHDPFYDKESLNNKNFIQTLYDTDILGLTCYFWNQSINDQICLKFKEINSNGVILLGGPNVPESFDYQQEYKNNRPWVDHFFVGPGEQIFVNFLLGATSEKFIHGKQLEGEQLPNPYLDGTLDNVLLNNKHLFSAPIETNRGCPYGCAFCDWGGQSNSKIKKIDHESVKKTIDYILNFDNIHRLEILDANFGIFEDDYKTIKYIAEQKNLKQKKLDLTFGGFAKNGSKHLFDIMEVIYDHFDERYKQPKVSLQSLNEQVLEKINRHNIKSEKILSVKDKVRNQGLNAELILGLPGETKETFINTLEKCIDYNINFVRAYHLFVLPNTLIANKKYQALHKIKIKKIFLPNDLIHINVDSDYNHIVNMKNYKTMIDQNDVLSHTVFEIMHSNESFDTIELHKIYRAWFWFNTFFNSGIAKNYILKDKKSLKDQIDSFYSNYKTHAIIRNIVDDFDDSFFSIFESDSDTFVNNLKNLYWIYTTSGRNSEIVKIYENKKLFEDEMKNFYPNFSTDHFDLIPRQKYSQLLSSVVTIDKFLL